MRPTLTSPFTLRDTALRNRIVFQPHFTALGRDGSPTDAHRAYYEERAAGGAALIVMESQAVHPTGRVCEAAVDAWDVRNIGPYTNITNAVHAYGAKIFAQLVHSGPDSLSPRPSMLWAPSPVPEFCSTSVPKAIDTEDIQELIEGFARSAKNAEVAGFDGIEVKIGHDGILHAFASPHLNQREDAYGRTMQGRLRLSVQVLDAIRTVTATRLVVGVRLCLNEYTPWGYSTDYGLELAQHLEATGMIDYINADAGTSASYWMQIPPTSVDESEFRHLSAELKKAVNLPVIAFGRVRHPEEAERILLRHEADLIGMARQLIADPYTPEKISAGREDEIRYCIGGNDSCIFQVAHRQPIRCDHNPAAGRERELSERLLRRSTRPQRVMVVGGGPAGLKVAETLARRGHTVELFEKASRLGGQVLLAREQPYHVEIFEVVGHLERSLNKLGVDVHLGAPITAADAADIDADAVIVATGSTPVVIRPVGQPHQHDADRWEWGGHHLNECPQSAFATVDDVLSGSRRGIRRAVVVDVTGHWDAAGTAEFLANAGAEVWLVSSQPVAAHALESANRELFFQRAASKRIHILSHTRVRGLGDRATSLTVEDVYTSCATDVADVDTIVPAMGRRADETLFREWKDLDTGWTIDRIGDCVAPRLLRDVVAEAYQLAMNF